MPSGKTHTKINLIGLPVIIAPLALLHPLHYEAIFVYAAGFLIGTYLLTPDLDTESDCYNNWGLFRFLWYPYQKFIPHRSILSHGLLIGDIIRILYLSIILFPLASFVNKQYGETTLLVWLEEHRDVLFVLILGVITASTFHIVLDKFYKPKRRKKR
ncbi:metal-binding protein [Priestia taiwanensis]|uniref:Peptidase n=1 Tax=Priestia taiwanensis TaxID=1347902 RepID=A0A917ASS4_9BACI|nr:metal-binding protein [Priestia taiwanensis]MBM7364071.1 putative metal-binding protein [Priestia taiwanensis]GGE71383.1 peptidase [Priestia taiwanensis]